VSLPENIARKRPYCSCLGHFGSVKLHTVGLKSVHSGYGWLLTVLRCLLLMMV